ncbi:MAG: DUF480 domain-containing protein [Planctomycetaceae bacterium]|nr:DUF480 domain-containing protein [Planctomycetaceae bacterium]
MIEPDSSDLPPVTELTRQQRRVLGVLSEKAFTTPEYYPLTLKAVIAGCNQKSNRDPVVNYSEDDVAEVLEQLREMSLTTVIYPQSGRTERYRHFLRHRFTFTEPQLAILTELLLRGRQSLGELRSRASRMVPIDSLGQLREELQGLIELGHAEASGDLERRGIEVDHTFYLPKERQPFAASSETEADVSPARSAPAAAPAATQQAAAQPAPPAVTGTGTGSAAATEFEDRLTKAEGELARLREENRELRSDLDAARQSVEDLKDRFEDLRQQLGG